MPRHFAGLQGHESSCSIIIFILAARMPSSNCKPNTANRCMKDSFYSLIENCTAHRPDRDRNAQLIFDHPERLTELMAVALNPTDPNHYKACWILELVLQKEIHRIVPHLDHFCKTLPSYAHDGAIRSLSKIVLFAVTEHGLMAKSGAEFLSAPQLKIMTEVCFDWLIGNQKVAAKAYAMRALFEIGKLHPWIYRELRSILELGYSQHSAAYKAATKDLLRRMKD